jgi:hypothetical protein
MKLKIIILSLLSFCILSSSQNNTKNFFPLKVGNKYVYYYSWFQLPGFQHGSGIKVSIVSGDTIAFGKRYFKASNFPFINNLWVRIDSLTGSLYKLDATNSCSYYDHELIIDSLLAKKNDTTKNCIPFSYERTLCTDTSYINIFGLIRQQKSFFNSCSIGPPINCTRNRKYIDSIGLSYYNFNVSGSGSSGGEQYQLRGCVLNGIVYGDTASVIGIIPIGSEIPNSFSLSQNFPNPFNPTTKIKFDVPQTSFTKLIIYNLLGREVATLVNEELKPGTYQTDWDASGFSSGVYFYKIIAGEYTETKKMVLMK